jgi:hydrogenase maturation protease
MKKVLLVGVGNPLSGDDGFGPIVLERLAPGKAALNPNITRLNAGTDLLDHIEIFADFDQVVLVDAVLDPDGKLGSPGRVETLEEDSFLSWSEKSGGVHQISPLLGVRLFRTLYPEAKVKFRLVGLFVDRLTHFTIYLTEDTITKAVKIIEKISMDLPNCTKE